MIRTCTWINVVILKTRFEKFSYPIHNVRPAITQQAITCSKLTIETLEQGVKYVQEIPEFHILF